MVASVDADAEAEAPHMLFRVKPRHRKFLGSAIDHLGSERCLAGLIVFSVRGGDQAEYTGQGGTYDEA